MVDWLNVLRGEKVESEARAEKGAGALATKILSEQVSDVIRAAGTASAADKLPPLELVETAIKAKPKAERPKDDFDTLLAVQAALPAKLSLENPKFVAFALAAFLPRDTPREITEFLKNVTAFKKNGTDFDIKLKDQVQLGDMPVFAGKDVSFSFVKSPDKQTAFAVDKIKGLIVKIPLPDEFLSKIGIKSDTAITRLAVGEPDAYGNRRISIETDGAAKKVSFDIGSDGKPLVQNNNGRTFSQIDLQFQTGQGEINCRFCTHIDGNNKIQLDQLDIKGTPGAKAEVLKALGVPEEIAVAGEKVKTIVSHNGGFKIYSEGATEANIRGLKVKLEDMIFVKANTRDNGGKPEHDVEIYGFSITGFDFKGDRWAKIGSSVLNYLGKSDGGLPIRIHRLSIADRDNNQSLITIKETTGALIAAQFLVDKNNPGNLIDGKLLISNPVNKFLKSPAPPVEISIKDGVVQKPSEIVFSSLDGVPLLKHNPLYSGAKLTYRLAQEIPLSELKQEIKQEVKQTVKSVGLKIESTGEKIGRKVETAAHSVQNGLNKGATWTANKAAAGLGWIRRKF